MNILIASFLVVSTLVTSINDSGYIEKFNESLRCTAESYNKLTENVELYSNLIESKELSPEELGYLYHCRSVAYYYLEDFEKSEQDIDNAISYLPEFPEPYINKGNIYAHNYDFGKAIEYYDKAISLNPGLSTPYHDKAYVYTLINKPQEALDNYSKAIELDPEQSMSYRWRAIVYLSLGRLDDSLNDLNKAVSINYNDDQALILRSQIYKSRNNFDSAIADLNTAISLKPANARYIASRGIIYFEIGELDKAITDFDRAILSDSSIANLYVLRSALFTLYGDTKRAINDLKSASDLGLTSAEQTISSLKKGISSLEVSPEKDVIENGSRIIINKIDSPDFSHQFHGEKLYMKEGTYSFNISCLNTNNSLNNYIFSLTVIPNKQYKLTGEIDHEGFCFASLIDSEGNSYEVTKLIPDTQKNYLSRDEFKNVQELIRKALTAYMKDKNYKEAKNIVTSMLEDYRLPADIKIKLLGLRVQLNYELKNQKEIISDLKQITVLDPGNFDYFLGLLDAYVRNKNHEKATELLFHIMSEFHQDINKIPYIEINTIVRELDIQNSKMLPELLERLFSTGYKGGPDNAELDNLYIQYMKVNLTRGKPESAIEYIDRIHNIIDLINLRQNREFEDLWNFPEFKEITSPSRILKITLEHSKKLMEEKPDRLSFVSRYIRNIHLMGKTSEAIQLAQEYIDKADEYSDKDRYLSWLYNDLSQYYFSINEFDKANLNMESAILHANRGESVNFMINYSLMLVEQDEYQRAILFSERAVDRGVSDYGRMLINAVQARAYYAIKERDKSNEFINKMKEDKKTNPAELINTLIFTGKIKEAGDILLSALEDERHKSNTIIRLQNYIENKSRPTKYQKIIRSGYKKLLGSKRIKEKVAEIARIDSFPFIKPYE